ncbi:DUF262 domain-containing protein [Nocardia cyriacigeorgica]|uniref:GmrSD restriction endonuclease domain-containing protein n=1 Tax=Nocardia cyriacigeorgica TaxID=135487 RepID=UPI00189510C3|nr:DUF262 domain-containing protein [Nocardia cyriacigeorgica]MBF6319014.1 DUF262 domain-containing protein [Nocardia cyriacigeorgica]MBF6531475.1 DUF262 domain-containing protein [Nocardia cyriacigeorgica]
MTDFLDWQRQGALNLRPYFQRGDVWTPKAKSYLIDTLIRGYPIPVIYLQNKHDRRAIKNVRQVVDGQQRLRTIFSYIAPEVLEEKTERDFFSILPSHNKTHAGKSFRELPEYVQQTIVDTELSVHVLPATLSDRHLLQLFARLNSTGERLNDQELRNAEYHGEFKALAYRISYEQIDRWQEWGVFAPRSLAQMRDVEFTSELMMLALSGIQAKNRATIDAYYKRYDDDFPYAFELFERVTRGMDRIDELYRSLSTHRNLKKIQSQSWLYALFAVCILSDNESTILPANKATEQFIGRVVPVSSLMQKCSVLLRMLDEGDLPDQLAKALRGASSDTASRVTRVQFLLQI